MLSLKDRHVVLHVPALDTDGSGEVAIKNRVMKAAQGSNGVVGGRSTVTATTVTTSKDSTAASRTHVGSTTTGQTKHRFKRKPRILFSQAQVRIMSFISVIVLIICLLYRSYCI